MESEGPEGWSETEYKSFRVDDASGSDTESEGGDDPDPERIRGYTKEKYKKILFVEELLPE
jgi:hypothetical protein